VVQGIDDINQCIAIILATPRGADYLRPTFGADLWQYIDQPITQSMPHLVREVTEALTLWEPRIKVVSVRAALVPANQTNQYGVHIAVTIVWQLKLSARYSPRDFQQHRTTVSITGALN
jgi:phage baseplate assembly protein W